MSIVIRNGATATNAGKLMRSCGNCGESRYTANTRCGECGSELLPERVPPFNSGDLW